MNFFEGLLENTLCSIDTLLGILGILDPFLNKTQETTLASHLANS
jgi:hypothetical protein